VSRVSREFGNKSMSHSVRCESRENSSVLKSSYLDAPKTIPMMGYHQKINGSGEEA